MDKIYFSKSVHNVLNLARQEAVRLQHDKIGLEHFLLGLFLSEKEISKYISQNTTLTIQSIQQLVNNFPKKEPFLPENLGFSSEAMHILELAIDESIQRGLTYVGIEAILLGLASDSNGIKILERVGISPVQVHENIQHNLQEFQDVATEVSSNLPTEHTFIRNEFFTPEHTIDIKKLLDHCPYPLYVLTSKPPSFYLCKTEPGIRVDMSGERYFTRVGFEFAYPNCFASFDKTQPVQRVRVENWNEKSLGDIRLWLTLDSIDTTITNNLLNFPQFFREMFDKKNLIGKSTITLWRQILNMVEWKPHFGSGLSLNVSHWGDAQLPVGWAYSSNEEPFIVIATLGVGYDDFLEVLNSLVILKRDNNDVINKLQEEMKS